jgi:hypothetical protein
MTCNRTRYKNRVDQLQRAKDRSKSSVRAKVEYPFRILKRVFGFTTVRYRGLAINHHRLCACSDLCRPAPETSRLTLQVDPQRSITLSIDASPAQHFTPPINCIPVQRFLRRPILLLAGTHKSLTYTTMRAIGGAVIVLLTLPLQRRRLPNV